MISLCTPTRARPDVFARMLSSAKETAEGPFEVCAWLDDDDPTRAQYPQDPLVRYGSGPRELDANGVPTMSYLWTRAWGLATGGIALLTGDDSIFRTPGWDTAVEAEFAKVPDRILMVSTDTGKVNAYNDNEPCNPFVSREWIEAVGYFTPPGYQGWFSDVHVWCLAAEIGRAVYLPDVLIEHMRRRNSDQTYRDGEQARAAVGGWDALFERFYSPLAVAERDEQADRLRAVMTSTEEIVPDPVPAWFTQSLERPQRNEDTLVVVHCYAGDRHQVVNALDQFTHHGCPVLVLSPEDAPVQIDHPGVECRSVGVASYIGQDSLDRQRAHLALLLTYPQSRFLLNDADSVCLSPVIPRYLYEAGDTVFSNEAIDPRPPHSPYPALALQPPYFVTRTAIERMLAVADRITADPVTPFIDWYMLALVCEAGLEHRSYPDGSGTSLRGWRYGEVPEAHEGPGDTPTGEVETGGVDGAALMEEAVLSGAVLIHSVKHPEVLARMVAAHDRYLHDPRLVAERRRRERAQRMADNRAARRARSAARA